MKDIWISLLPSSPSKTKTETDAAINFLIVIIDYLQDLFHNQIFCLDQISEFLRPTELIITFEHVLQILKIGNIFSKILEKQPLLEKLILFLTTIPKFQYDISKSNFINILTCLYNDRFLFRAYINKDDFMKNVFQKLILEDRKEIFFHFMDNLYFDAIFNSVNEFRRKMLKNIIDYFSSKMGSNKVIDNEYDIKCIAAFLKTLIKLMCYEKIMNFSTFFEESLQFEIKDFSSILFVKVI